MNKTVKSFAVGTQSSKAVVLGLATIIGLASVLPAALAAPPAAQSSRSFKLHNPDLSTIKPAPLPAPTYEDDILLVMPNLKSDKDEFKETMKELHGTVVGQMGQGELTVLVVKTEKGKLLQTESKMLKDSKHFGTVSRSYTSYAEYAPSDPSFPASWHLTAMNCPKAWDITRELGKEPARCHIFDSGCKATVRDLNPGTAWGFDAVYLSVFGDLVSDYTDLMGINNAVDMTKKLIGDPQWIPGVKKGNVDSHGHGTWVASTLGAAINDQVTCGVAPFAPIYPVRIAYGTRGGTASTNDRDLIMAMVGALNSKAKIINISYGTSLIGIHNPTFHSVLHKFFKYFHDKQGGLIFLSAGNDGVYDTLNNDLPYLIMVSAIDQTGSLSKFKKGGSNYGPYVDFTAPGSDIVVSDIDGKSANVNGTSFSSPIVAGVAALVWGARPSLTNNQVEFCLRASAVNTTPGAKNDFYGWGMPDAERALKIALGRPN